MWLSRLSTPRRRSTAAEPRRVLKFSWARPEGLGPSKCAFRNSRKELPR